MDDAGRMERALSRAAELRERARAMEADARRLRREAETIMEQLRTENLTWSARRGLRASEWRIEKDEQR